MKPGSNRRPRSRPNNNNNNNKQRQGGRNSYDSNGPDGKVRGTAQQVLEKYQALGRDAMSAGDRIAAEAYFQFAEHYYRLVNADGAQQQPRKDQRPEQDAEFQSDALENKAVEGNEIEVQNRTEPDDAAPAAPEVVTVPIMPGPIVSPNRDGVSTDKPEQPDLLASNDEDVVVVAVESDEEKPKPVRRRRPRAKPDAAKEAGVEPVQA